MVDTYEKWLLSLLLTGNGSPEVGVAGQRYQPQGAVLVLMLRPPDVRPPDMACCLLTPAL